jgi:hypothetical protein
MRNARGGCGVLGHGGVFGVAVERKSRVAVVGRVFVAGSAVVAVVPAGEEAHDICCASIIMQLAPYLAGRRRAAAGSAGPGWILEKRPSGRRLSGTCYLLQYRYRSGVYVRGWYRWWYGGTSEEGRRGRKTRVADTTLLLPLLLSRRKRSCNEH